MASIIQALVATWNLLQQTFLHLGNRLPVDALHGYIDPKRIRSAGDGNQIAQKALFRIVHPEFVAATHQHDLAIMFLATEQRIPSAEPVLILHIPLDIQRMLMIMITGFQMENHLNDIFQRYLSQPFVGGNPFDLTGNALRQSIVDICLF